MALVPGIQSSCRLCGFLKCLFQLEMKHESVRQLWVINLEESPHICCPCRLSYSHTHATTPFPAAGAAFPLSGRPGAILCLQKWSSIPTSAQKMDFQCICTKCKKIPEHGRKAIEEMLLFFTDYLTSVKHRPESPMSCTIEPWLSGRSII